MKRHPKRDARLLMKARQAKRKRRRQREKETHTPVMAQVDSVGFWAALTKHWRTQPE